LSLFNKISIYFILTIFVMVSCSAPKPEPQPYPKPKKEHTPPRKSKTTSKTKNTKTEIRETIFDYTPEFLIPKPTKQNHIFELSFVDVDGNSITGVKFEAEIELLGSSIHEQLLQSKTISEFSDEFGKVRFEINHPITSTKTGYSTYTLVNFVAYKDDFLDVQGSVDINHNETEITKQYLSEKKRFKKITLLNPRDFINSAFDLYTNDANINYADIENCIETFALFPSTYGDLKTGSVKIIKDDGKFYLEFGFDISVDNDWLLETYKSIGRRIGLPLFDSDINGIRLRINQATTYTTTKDSLDKYIDRVYTDTKFLKKIKKG
jgi:hypothetical protein